MCVASQGRQTVVRRLAGVPTLGRAGRSRYAGGHDEWFPPDSSAAAQPRRRHGAASWFSLSARRVGLALALGALAAILLDPIFITPLSVLLGRTLFVALLGLLSFSAVGQWPRELPRWLARWFLQVVAVVLTVPLATLLVYLVSVGGDLAALWRSEGRILGFLWIAGSGLLVAPLLAMGALYRQRDTEARNEALRFELERSELERRALDARLRLLQAQVEPHFLVQHAGQYPRPGRNRFAAGGAGVAQPDQLSARRHATAA